MTPPRLTRREASTAATRERLMLSACAYTDPDTWMAVEAAADTLTLVQLDGYVTLLAAGEHYQTAANLLARVPDADVPEAVERVVKAMRA